MVMRSHRGEIRGGFTLMEMLVVVAIIVLLAAMAAPIVMGRLDEAKVSRARIDCVQWSKAAEMYKLKYGDWPPNLEALTQPGQDGTQAFMEAKNLLDPWGRQYMYQNPGQHNLATGKPDIYSYGLRVNDASSIVGNW
jgi:general secretion pathway protein G